IHDLRHTAASLAVSAGANVKAVQRMLGHSTATQTMDRYAHLFTDDLEALAERLETLFVQANAYSARTQPVDEVLELAG
ncbi:MAG: tyrosine-type recombinase/integrase, partial [Actinobacteria bacterium]|nr:tyrosine-type recombinase/integrase [Actinomycetota bacterium]